MGKHDPDLGRPLTGAERAARHRMAMQAKGYRRKQFWLPDAGDPAWRAEASRQSALAAASETEDDKAFYASLIDWDELPLD
jgi:hypothetical protein